MAQPSLLHSLLRIALCSCCKGHLQPLTLYRSELPLLHVPAGSASGKV